MQQIVKLGEHSCGLVLAYSCLLQLDVKAQLDLDSMIVQSNL